MPCLFQSIEPQHSDVKELCMFENLALLEPRMSLQHIFLEDGHVARKYMIVAHKWLLAVVDSTAWVPHTDPISDHRSICLDQILITVIDKFCAQVACMIPSRLSSASHSKVLSIDSTMPSLSLVYCTMRDLEQVTCIMMQLEE